MATITAMVSMAMDFFNVGRRYVMNIPAYYVQRQIARVESTSVASDGTNVVYSFRSHPFITAPYNGIVIIKLQAPPTLTTPEPIVFNSGDGNKAVVGYNNVALTSADISGAGVYLFYYDSSTGVIQLINV